MSGLPIRNLRQLAIGSSQAVRPLASTTTSTATTSIASAAVRNASSFPFKHQSIEEAEAFAAKVAKLRAKRRALQKVPSTAAVQAQRLPKPKKPTTIPPKPTTAPVVPYRRYKQPKPELTKFPEGHGEQIWIYNHIVTNQVVYSHSPTLRQNRALKQLPFNGKQTKPAKIRKDYWQPMALIQFNEGEGVVGRSVYQKLREFRRVHELSWGHQRKDLYAMDRKALGEGLNDQRANSIADMAAVLAGAGQGNRVKVSAADASSSTSDVVPATGKLAEVIVFWANDQDRNIAEKWSKNVRHAAGMPSLSARTAVIEQEAPEL
ncbi:hypothetical protein Sste5346_003972 [Sporothrix stenoceras]|uniref:Large ribosomal subunit protein mL67 n=1 Tax=Sporothrix stenoceras TaxID=5173 RepID=A0ABR3ZDS8_9PEZI